MATIKIASMGGFILAPTEGCSLRLQRWGPSGSVFCFLGKKIYVEKKKSCEKKCLAKNKIWRKNYFWPLTVDSWQLTVGRWRLACGSWQVVFSRWQVEGGIWPNCLRALRKAGIKCFALINGIR